MTKDDMTLEILTAKKAAKKDWQDLAAEVGLNPVYLTSACLGMNHLDVEQAGKLAGILSLSSDASEALQEFPNKQWSQIVPTDPLIYRWYEIVGVYGETIKELIHEKFGDGIMSAIDFSMDIGKEENPAGDRVLVTMSGKFLPYKSW